MKVKKRQYKSKKSRPLKKSKSKAKKVSKRRVKKMRGGECYSIIRKTSDKQGYYLGEFTHDEDKTLKASFGIMKHKDTYSILALRVNEAGEPGDIVSFVYDDKIKEYIDTGPQETLDKYIREIDVLINLENDMEELKPQTHTYTESNPLPESRQGTPEQQQKYQEREKKRTTILTMRKQFRTYCFQTLINDILTGLYNKLKKKFKPLAKYPVNPLEGQR